MNYLKQEAEASKRMSERGKQILELAKKHNVTVSSQVHDETIFEGSKENLEAFFEELLTLIS